MKIEELYEEAKLADVKDHESGRTYAEMEKALEKMREQDRGPGGGDYTRREIRHLTQTLQSMRAVWERKQKNK